jgi:hypothetical protein
MTETSAHDDGNSMWKAMFGDMPIGPVYAPVDEERERAIQERMAAGAGTWKL